jgi:hypothetical protein
MLKASDLLTDSAFAIKENNAAKINVKTILFIKYLK